MIRAANVFSATLALGAALASLPSAKADALRDTTPSIAVVGEASQELAPDRAVVRFGVVSEKATAVQAAAENARIAEAILAEIKAMGVADADLQTQNVNLEPFTIVEKDAKGKAKQTQRYRARNDLAVRVKPATRAGEVAGRVIDKGANSLEGIDFEFSDPSAAVDPLRAAAVKDALRRAQVYAEAAGLRLSRVLEIRPLDDAPAPMAFAGAAMKAEARAVGDMSVRPGVQRVSQRVSIIWALSR